MQRLVSLVVLSVALGFWLVISIQSVRGSRGGNPAGDLAAMMLLGLSVYVAVAVPVLASLVVNPARREGRTEV